MDELKNDLAPAQELIYYPKERLNLEEDVPGSKMWGVALEKAMLTYFEVDPHSRFDSHRHESEQITMVLEGELFFEAGGKISKVQSGEVIAVPSFVSHSVYTMEKAARAVDAWSPVMPQYQR